MQGEGFWIADDFDAPLPDDLRAAFEGGDRACCSTRSWPSGGRSTPSACPGACLDAVQGAEGEVFLGRASRWQMATERGIGKLHPDLARFVSRVEADGFRWLSIESRHILELAGLPQADDHEDPFDRLPAAPSRAEPSRSSC